MNTPELFDRVCCINLPHRADRWTRFQAGLPSDWPFAPVERVSAIDGKQVPAPRWWRPTAGAWGCYRSHVRVIEDALNEGLDSILILEDDALFEPDFAVKVRAFLNRVPDDWGMLYLGGQHLKTKKVVPRAINEEVCIPYNVNRTHAYALRGATMKAVYRHLTSNHWDDGHHIDHHLGRFHERHDRRFPIYCPRHWLVGQAAGESNITRRNFPERTWDERDGVDLNQQRFVAVLGLHSSGSSALAGIIWGLGVYLGDELGGYYGNQPGAKCGYEDAELSEICESIIPFPTIPSDTDASHESCLRDWIMGQRAQGHRLNTVSGGKHPLLCQLGHPLRQICGERLRLIVSERNLDESIRSLQRRCPGINPHQIEAHQRWLWDGLQELRRCVPASHQLVVRYDELLNNPEREAYRVTQFLDIQDSNMARDIAKAVESIQIYAFDRRQQVC